MKEMRDCDYKNTARNIKIKEILLLIIIARTTL